MKRTQSWKKTSQMGKYVKEKWSYITKKNNIDIVINNSIHSIPSFQFKKNHDIKIKFFIKEMLKNKILASNYMFVSIKHNKKNTKKYFQCFDMIMKKLKKNNIHKYNQKEKNILMQRFN